MYVAVTDIYLSTGVDVSDRVANGNSTHHLIVEEGVEIANVTRKACSRGNGVVWNGVWI